MLVALLRLTSFVVEVVVCRGGRRRHRIVASAATVSLLVAPGAQLPSVLVDGGEIGEVEEQGSGEASEACHVKGQRLAGLQVVQGSVTRRPESWEALMKNQKWRNTKETQSKGKKERKNDMVEE